MNPLARITQRCVGQIAIVCVAGEVDLSNAPELAQAITSAASDAAALVLDLDELTYLDSAGLRMIESIGRRHHATRLVVGDTAIVRRSLAIAGFEHRFAIDSSVAAAITELDGPPH